MSPVPNAGPQLDRLLIACGGFGTLLLNGARPSLLRSENIDTLEVEPYLPSDPEKTKILQRGI